MLGGDSFDGNPLRKNIFAAIAGFIFSVGWWFIIDYGALEKEGTSYRELSFVYVLPAIFCSLCMLIFNAFKWEDFQGEGFSEFNTSRARAFFMVGLIGMFLTMGFGIWVAQDKFIDTLYNDYGGVCIIINLILIFVAAVVLRVGTASS